MPHVIRLRGPWEYQPLARFVAGSGGALVEESAALPPPGRSVVPSDWSRVLGADFRGRVCYQRRFNSPTRLEPHERVWLVIGGVDGRARVALNDQSLGETQGYALRAAYDVTRIMRPANVLELEIELPLAAPSGSASEATPAARAQHDVPTSHRAALLRPGRETLPGGPIGEVWLEIRAAWHVERESVYFSPHDPTHLHVRGHAAAQPDLAAHDAQLLVVGGDRECLCEPITLGSDFAFQVPIEGWPPWPSVDGTSVLTPVEVRLLVDGFNVWQATFETAPPHADDDPVRRAVIDAVLSDGPAEWLDYVDERSAGFASLLRRGGGTVVGSRAMQSHTVYQQLSRASIGVLQQIPADWSGEVCRRLAHHPSILAWGARLDELSTRRAQLEQNACGRQWVAVRPR